MHQQQWPFPNSPGTSSLLSYTNSNGECPTHIKGDCPTHMCFPTTCPSSHIVHLNTLHRIQHTSTLHLATSVDILDSRALLSFVFSMPSLFHYCLSRSIFLSNHGKFPTFVQCGQSTAGFRFRSLSSRSGSRSAVWHHRALQRPLFCHRPCKKGVSSWTYERTSTTIWEKRLVA